MVAQKTECLTVYHRYSKYFEGVIAFSVATLNINTKISNGLLAEQQIL